MFLKRFFCGLMMICIFALSCTVAAARTGEFETQFVEFKALVPDDFEAPVHIEFTEKNTKAVLNYYLYSVNGYFNNDGVVFGDYTVKVSVPDAKEGDFNFIYDKEFYVEESAVAISFTVIIDNACLIGDVENTATDSSSKVVSNNNNGSVIASGVNDTEVDKISEDIISDSSEGDKVSSEYDEDVIVSSGRSSIFPIVISFILSFLAIVIGAIVFGFIKKRNY